MMSNIYVLCFSYSKSVFRPIYCCSVVNIKFWYIVHFYIKFAKKCSVPKKSEEHSDKDTYFAAAVNREIQACFPEDHKNGPFFWNPIQPDLNFLSFSSAAKSVSEKNLSRDIF